MKGVYSLIIDVSQPTVLTLGSLGQVDFFPGMWIYVGSAMGATSTSLEHRLKRHFSNDKTMHWHIDHLLETSASISGALYAESEEPMECVLATALGKSPQFESGPKGFGASDCRAGCGSHIFRFIDEGNLFDIIEHQFQSLELTSIRKTD
jgi:Uri superfamily endonuclease